MKKCLLNIYHERQLLLFRLSWRRKFVILLCQILVSHVAGCAAFFFLGDQVGHDCGLEELMAEQETNEGPEDHDQRDE